MLAAPSRVFCARVYTRPKFSAIITAPGEKCGLAVTVMMALALGAVLAGRPERMRSLVDPGLPLAA